MKIRILSILLLLVLLLTACQSAGAGAGISYNGLPAITPELKQEIEAVFSEKGMEEFYWEELVAGDRVLMETIGYYGTYDGYSIFHASYGGVAAVAGEAYIEDVLIDINASGGDIVRYYAYKDGELTNLADAYEKGYVTIETVQKVADLRGQRFLDNWWKNIEKQDPEEASKYPKDYIPDYLMPFFEDK